MSYYKESRDYIKMNLDAYIREFFPEAEVKENAKGYRLNPAPCCGHRDCFNIAKEIDAVNCHSCGAKGNRYSYLETVFGEQNAADRFQQWSGITKNQNYNQQDIEKMREQEQLNEIKLFAVDFYNQQLLHPKSEEAKLALGKQLNTEVHKGGRGHTKDSLLQFKVGVSLDNFSELRERIKAKGYPQHIVDKAEREIWVPPFYYTYPYFKGGKLVRINAKAFMRVCLGSKNEDGTYTKDCACRFLKEDKEGIKEHTEETEHELSNLIFSTGDRGDVFFGLLKSRIAKSLIVTEGEDDVITIVEHLKKEGIEDQFDVKGTGGNPSKYAFASKEVRQYERIYGAFDDDLPGKRFLEQLNDSAADVDVFSVEYSSGGDYKDIDLYLRSTDESFPRLKTLLEEAVPLQTYRIVIYQKGKNEWVGKNRKYEMHFKAESINKKSGQLEGSFLLTSGGKLVNKNSGSLDRISVKATFQNGKFEFSKYLEDYYNRVPWDTDKPARPYQELLDIVKLTKNQEAVTKQIAWYLYHADTNLYNNHYKMLERVVADQNVIAIVLKEVNAFSNQEFDLSQMPPTITLTQYFNIGNNDAYFYFNRLTQDGGDVKLVPFLLSNQKKEIRLDLIRQKDPQNLMLIENKYALPEETPTARMVAEEVSLQPVWVDRWKAGEVKPEEIDPKNLIVEIEEFIKKFMYSTPETIKVLALWIYATYFHMLFQSGFPYLMLNGPKGTGKTTVDDILYMLSLNAKMGLDFSSSSLYRLIAFEGGTFILDEMENLSDKKRVDNSDMAKILKGGYAANSFVYRTNMDKNGATDRFSVFGPKVISNINGLDDVIEDRCIVIRTFRVPTEKLAKLEKTALYRGELRHIAHSITSRCVLSALENFQHVHETFMSLDSAFESGVARLNQIIRPLVCIAKVVGGDYEEALLRFYTTDIEQAKKDVLEGTLEGRVTKVLKDAAKELIEKELKYVTDEHWVTKSDNLLYSQPITFDRLSKTFVIDSMHFKVLVDEQEPDEPVPMRILHQTIHNILGRHFDLKKQRSRHSLHWTNENLIRVMGNKNTIRGYRYTIPLSDWQPELTKHLDGQPLGEEERFF